MKTQKENKVEPTVIDGQISLDDILNSADDGTFGKPADEYEVQS